MPLGASFQRRCTEHSLAQRSEKERPHLDRRLPHGISYTCWFIGKVVCRVLKSLRPSRLVPTRTSGPEQPVKVSYLQGLANPSVTRASLRLLVARAERCRLAGRNNHYEQPLRSSHKTQSQARKAKLGDSGNSNAAAADRRRHSRASRLRRRRTSRIAAARQRGGGKHDGAPGGPVTPRDAQKTPLYG